MRGLIRDTFVKGAKELGIPVNDKAITPLELFAGELLKWNSRINLTAIKADDEIAIKHFLDSLVLSELIGEAGSLLDIGSGAGIPSIPVKIFRPQLKVVSVDAVGKKIIFQRHIARMLRLINFEPVHARAESMHGRYSGQFDVITSRAFSHLEKFAEVAHPFLARGGRMIAMKGPSPDNEITAASSIISDMDCEIVARQAYYLPFGMGERSIVVIAASDPR